MSFRFSVLCEDLHKAEVRSSALWKALHKAEEETVTATCMIFRSWHEPAARPTKIIAQKLLSKLHNKAIFYPWAGMDHVHGYQSAEFSCLDHGFVAQYLGAD